MGDYLSELQAWSDLAQQEQARQRNTPPPSGSPQRPAINLIPATPPAAAPQVSPKRSLFDRASDLITGIGKAAQDPATYAAIGSGIVRAPGQLLGGLADTMSDVDKFSQDNIDPAFVRKTLHAASYLNPALNAERIYHALSPNGASLADALSFRKSLGQVGNPQINQGAAQAGAVALSLPFGGEGATEGLTANVAKLLRSSAKVGTATALTADTTGSSNPLQTRGVEGAAGAAVNLVAEPLLGVIGDYIKGKLPTKVVEATPEDALSDHLDRAFATARTTEARYQLQERATAGRQDGAAPQEPGEGATAQDGSPQENKTGAPPSAVTPLGRGTRLADTDAPDPYADANAALKAAGSAETVDAEANPLRPDGRIPVSDASKAALDRAGMGRAFAAESEGATSEPVIFREEDGSGEGRVVGAIGKADLQGFKEDVEAIRQSAETPLDTDATHPVGQWKLSTLGAPYDVAPFLRGLADQLPPRAEALTDAEVMKQAKTLADQIGWDPADMLAFAAQVAGDVKQLPQAMATVRTVYARAGSTVDALLDRHSDWSALADDHPDLREALQAVHNVVTLGQAVADFKTAAGQTLRTAGLPDADSYLATFGKTPAEILKPVDPLDGLPKLPRNKAELKQWLDAWGYTSGNPTARDAFIKGLTFMPGKWMALRTSFANFFTAAIISGPATFLRDLMGPAIIGGLRTLERTTGGYAAALMPWTDAGTRAELLRAASQAPSAYLQTIGAMGDALKAGARAFASGDQLLQPSTVYNFRSKAIPAGLIDAATQATPGVTGRIPYLLANAVNVFPGWIHALHGGVNEFAQRLAYLGEVRASAMLEAAGQGLTGDDFSNYVRARLLNSTDEVTWAANDPAALASSQRTTLIKPVGGDSQPIVSRFNDFIHSLRTNFPESRYVLPIFTVPANAIGEGIRRLPVGLLFDETQRELSGQAGAAAQAEAYGRVLLGASTLLGGFAMARAGLITGPGPQQARDREVWEAQGFQPYAIRLGDHWVSYNRMDVLGSILAIPAAIYDRSVHTQLDNSSATFAGVAALAEYFKDQAALQGLSDLLSFGGSPQEAQGYLRRLTDQIAGGFVPNFITQLGRNNLDPERRVVRDPFEAVLDKLPGASKLLDPQRDALGEETYKVQNALWGLLPFSITSANSYAKDPIADELDRLYQVSGYAPGLKSPSLNGGKEDTRDIQLEDGHSLYDALVRYRGIVTNDEGQSLREALKRLIDGDEYNAAVDGDGNNLRTSAGDMDRGAMVAQLFHDFDRRAQQQVARDSPNAARYLAVGAIKRQNDAALRDTPAEAIVRNPALLSALGINLADYEDKVRGQ